MLKRFKSVISISNKKMFDKFILIRFLSGEAIFWVISNPQPNYFFYKISASVLFTKPEIKTLMATLLLTVGI